MAPRTDQDARHSQKGKTTWCLSTSACRWRGRPRRRLVAADIGARALPQFDIESDRRTEHAIAKQARGARLRHRLEKSPRREWILATDVHVAVLAAGGIRGY